MSSEPGSRPWEWPAQWAVSESFWREVATRTIAGMLTLVFLGVPGVIYAVYFGALTQEQGWLIGIGLGLFVILVLLYVVFLSIARAITRRTARSSSGAPQAARLVTAQRTAALSQILALVGAVLGTVLAGSSAFDVLQLLFNP